MANPLTDKQAWRREVVVILRDLLAGQTLLLAQQRALAEALERLVPYVQADAARRDAAGA